MSTSYEPIFDKFIKKLKNDDQFFSYKGMDTEELEEILKDHLNSLLDRAVSYIYKFGKPDINLYNRSDDTQKFDVDLVNQEIDLLSDLMYTCYIQEQRNKIKAFGLTFKSSELNVFSPANERKSTLDMIKGLEEESINSIQNYLSRERKTWEYKSIYSSGST
ncbi:hypothetical protein P4H70_14940 [Paenibacillus ehimensis]|uniref:hypothetical protein n=1 Tax=Paenibacillus ehimensis TaxID=79264 RepID=UPI002DB5AC39|nr:hypothetical protein [Paenibacillus ehimensis]MEC0210232.1 hypothetical protein [Paenibacillus ehimensis]